MKKEKYDNKMEEILEIIKKNPESLEKLDVEKLEIIDKYYDEKIKEYKKKIGNKS